MRRHLLDLIVMFFFISVIAGYVALAQPSLRNVTLHAYVFLVGGLLMLGIVAAAGDRVPHRHRSELAAALGAAKRRQKQLPEIEKLQREVTLATASAYDLHYRLLPHLREIAADAALAQRQERESGDARALVGPASPRPAAAR